MSKHLLKSTSVVSAMTLLSRVMGFVRDTLVAQIYGVTAGVDAFYVAFKIPNFMRNLFAEGCFSQAFVPVLTEYQHQKSPEEVRHFISHVAGALGSFLMGLTLLCVLFAPFLVTLFAPGFTAGDDRFIWATHMLRITFPYLMLISLTALAGGILNSVGRFAAPAFTPVLLNVAMIVAALWGSQYFDPPVKAQAWSIFAAGVLQLAFQAPFLRRQGLLVWPRIQWRDPGVRRVLALMLPALFGSSVGQLGLLINTIFVSFLKVGSVTWLYYAERLAYFPLGVFGVALATVVLPHLSKQHAARSPSEFAATLDWGVRCNLLIGLPATVALIILAGPLIATLMQYGRFHAYDVLMTRQSAIAYAVGLQAFMLVKVLASGFYARQDIRTPVKIGMITVVVNIILNAALVGPLAHSGLALAASLSAWINTALLWTVLHQRGIYRVQSGATLFLLRVMFANAVMAGWLVYEAGDLAQWLAWGWQTRAAHVGFLGLGAFMIYVAGLWVSGLRLQDLKVKTYGIDPRAA